MAGFQAPEEAAVLPGRGLLFWTALSHTSFNDTLTVIQSPIQATLVLQSADALLDWTSGSLAYRVQRATDLAVGDWTEFPTNATPPVSVPLTNQAGFCWIAGQ